MTPSPLLPPPRPAPSRARRLARLGACALAGARAALDVSTALMNRTAGLERTNFHGRAVSLRGGLGAAAGAMTAAAACASRSAARSAAAVGAAGAVGPGSTVSTGSTAVRPVGHLNAAALAALVSTTAAAGAGLVDDLDAGAHDGEQVAKGLKGHLRALARGHVTTGVLKIAVIGGSALVAGAILSGSRAGVRGAATGPRGVGRLVDAAGSAVVVASWANVMNLLDLRPGRALKAAGLGGAALLAGAGDQAPATGRLAAGSLGVVAACLPEDLGERTMLGDTGANALGALLGTAVAAHPSRTLRTGAGLAGVALILVSERVSFSRVIERTPVLRWIDALGRPGRQP